MQRAHEHTVPPSIDDSLSSSDVIVREGSNVTLRCRAAGSPTPMVKWKRDSMEKIAINKSLVGEYNAGSMEKCIDFFCVCRYRVSMYRNS